MRPSTILRQASSLVTLLLLAGGATAQSPLPSVLPDGTKTSPLIAQPAISSSPTRLPVFPTKMDAPPPASSTHSTAPSPVHAPSSHLSDVTPHELTLHDEGHGGGHGNGHGNGHGAGHDEHEGGFYGTAEYLLLRTRRGAFDFATVSNTTAPTPDGPLESLRYSQRSGVRVNIGYQLPGEGWDVTAGYTFLRTSANRTVVAPAGGVLYPTLTRPGIVDLANSATASASLEYNVFDAEIGKRFHTERGSFRVYGAGKFATIRQDFDATYDGRDAQRAQVMTRNNFQGFGPAIGGEASMTTWGHFQVFARANAGLLTGSVTSPIIETNQAGLVRLANLSYRVNKVVPTAGVGIGGGWANGRVAIRAGYEVTNWFGLLEAPRFTGDFSPGRVVTRSESLSLEGLFVQVGVGF